MVLGFGVVMVSGMGSAAMRTQFAPFSTIYDRGRFGCGNQVEV